MTNKYVPIIGITQKYNIILLLFYGQCSKTNGSALVAVVLPIPAAERDHIRIRNHFLHRTARQCLRYRFCIRYSHSIIESFSRL